MVVHMAALREARHHLVMDMVVPRVAREVVLTVQEVMDTAALREARHHHLVMDMVAPKDPRHHHHQLVMDMVLEVMDMVPRDPRHLPRVASMVTIKRSFDGVTGLGLLMLRVYRTAKYRCFLNRYI